MSAPTPRPFHIDPDIRCAEAMPAEVYRSHAWLELQRERVFSSSWQLLADRAALAEVEPARLLPGLLDVPLVVVDRERVLANVCTHRGKLLVTEPGAPRILRCGYHGRTFARDGRCLAMPEFEGVVGFPGPRDDLARVPSGIWQRLLFAGVAPRMPFAEWLAPVTDRASWIDLGAARLDERVYEFRGNWALYVDNYLEGLHIPFLHAQLHGKLDWQSYEYHMFPWGNLQVGIAADGEAAFAPAADHSDAGRRVAAYYFWLWPNLMLNFYPWGLSANVVEPLAVDRTRVRFLWFVTAPDLRGAGAGGDLHTVELEDEAAIEDVQKGLASPWFERGRYSPSHERLVHQFHGLMARVLAAGS
jgi:choline monooxygenase